MVIKSEAFTGGTHPHMWPNPIIAEEQMNDWRRRNPDLRLISIETRQRIPARTEPDTEFIEPMFDRLLIWYED